MTRTTWLTATIGTATLVWLELHPLMLGVRPVLVFVLAGVLSSMQPRFAVAWGFLAGGTAAGAELAWGVAGAPAAYAIALAVISVFGIGACGAGAGRSLSAALEVREGSRPK